MSIAADPLNDYLQVRRVIARVCLANEHLSHEERLVLASSVGGASNLPQEMIKVLLKDTSEMPPICDLMKLLSQPGQFRQLLIDLAALAVVKGDWEETELAAAGDVIRALPVDDHTHSALNEAFATLRRASESLVGIPA